MRTAKTSTKKARCINPDCPSKGTQYTRGLCELCYKSLRRLIEVKKSLTWKEAEDRGLCRPRMPSGSKRFPIEAQRSAKRAVAGAKA